MTSQRSLKQNPFFVCLYLLAIIHLPALAENPFFEKGIAEYNAGNYQEAVGDLGAAESAEFDKPILHYYMANAFAHLHQNESAIREYRIAYALKPEGELGKLCALALDYYKPVAASDKSAKPGSNNSQPDLPKLDLIHQQALNLLQQEADSMRLSHKTEAQSRAESAIKLTDQQIQQLQRQRQDIIDAATNNRGSQRYVPFTDDIDDRLDYLRKVSNSQKANYFRNNSYSTNTVDEAASNLQNLLLDKSASHGPKLEPAGTSLYVRNYSHPGTTDKAPLSTKKEASKP